MFHWQGSIEIHKTIETYLLFNE